MPFEGKDDPNRRAYTEADCAKDTGVRSAAVVRCIFRSTGIKRMRNGWCWPDKAAAKQAPEAVSQAQRAVVR